MVTNNIDRFILIKDKHDAIDNTNQRHCAEQIGPEKSRNLSSFRTLLKPISCSCGFRMGLLFVANSRWKVYLRFIRRVERSIAFSLCFLCLSLLADERSSGWEYLRLAWLHLSILSDGTIWLRKGSTCRVHGEPEVKEEEHLRIFRIFEHDVKSKSIRASGRFRN